MPQSKSSKRDKRASLIHKSGPAVSKSNKEERKSLNHRPSAFKHQESYVSTIINTEGAEVGLNSTEYVDPRNNCHILFTGSNKNPLIADKGRMRGKMQEPEDGGYLLFNDTIDSQKK